MTTDIPASPFVSTGHLPPHGAVADLVREAYERFRGVGEFSSTAAVERSADGRTNPMVNPGAIVTTSLLPGDGEEK